MPKNRGGGILIGIIMLVVIVVVYPFAQPVVEDVVTIILNITSANVVPGTLEYVIIETMPWWGLAVAIIAALALIVFSGRKRGGGL